METLAKRLQWAIENRRRPDQRRWSAKGLSRAAGLAEAHVGQILRGEVISSRPDTLEALSKQLSVSYVWLATGRGRPEDEGGAGPEVRVERDPSALVDTSNASSRIAQALGLAFRAGPHHISDISTAEKHLRTAMHLEHTDDAQLVEAAGKWLDAVAWFRVRGIVPTDGDLNIHVTLGKTERAREVDEAAGKALSAAWDREGPALEGQENAGDRVRAALSPSKKIRTNS